MKFENIALWALAIFFALLFTIPLIYGIVRDNQRLNEYRETCHAFGGVPVWDGWQMQCIKMSDLK